MYNMYVCVYLHDYTHTCMCLYHYSLLIFILCDYSLIKIHIVYLTIARQTIIITMSYVRVCFYICVYTLIHYVTYTL